MSVSFSFSFALEAAFDFDFCDFDNVVELELLAVVDSRLLLALLLFAVAVEVMVPTLLPMSLLEIVWFLTDWTVEIGKTVRGWSVIMFTDWNIGRVCKG